MEGTNGQTLTHNEKQELFDMANLFVNMTLNGEPARLYGRKLEFPIIAQTQGNLKAGFAWPTIKRIVAAGGDFEI